MTIEIQMLIASSVLTVLHILPYAMAYFRYWNLQTVMGNRLDVPEIPEWAKRAQLAHGNMNENFPHFAAIVLSAAYLGIANEMTAMGAVLFFWARLGYLVAYTLGITWVRSGLFVAGIAGEIMIIVQIIKHGL
ncbi:MAG: MAPEG family protein [Gammaproteobacteria bacterium]|nr:MAPEG family protein [Gammaproteobacteria bacterium]